MSRIFWLYILMLFSYACPAQENLPVPKDSKDRLFYLQRDPNSNTVVYDINYLPDGTPNAKKPIHAYWIKYMKGGIIEELLPIEEKLAYGVLSEMTDDKSKIFKINLAAYKKIDILLRPNKKKGDKKYVATVNANGKNIILTKIFLRLKNAASFKPDLVYIEFTGVDEKTGQQVVERVMPD